MSSIRPAFLGVSILLMSAVCAGQPLTIGFSGGLITDRLPVDGVETFVDLVSPASATGTIDRAFFGWTQAPCPATAKIKIFRREGDTLAFVAERGPFDVTINPMEVALDPPIEVHQGDSIGIARVSNCGGPYGVPDGIFSGLGPLEGHAVFRGDLTSDVPFANGEIESDAAVRVTALGSATESIVAVLPAAGSTSGAFESFFRTSLQLSNVSPYPFSGRLVYHAQGSPSSPDDPSLPYTIEPRSTVAFTDVVEAIGETGLGTLDIVVPVTTGVPLITARVYNDGGDQGTTGFTEDAINSTCCTDSRVLYIGSTSFLVAPADPARFRFNIGIRSLFKAPTLTFTVVGTSAQATRSYPPNTLIQQPVEDLLGPIPANALIAIDVSAGTAIVYGATVDNTTNDPSLQYARIVSASPN